MTELYAMRVPNNIPSGQYHLLLSIIDPDKKERILRFKYKVDSYRSLLADILIRYLSSEKLSIDISDIQFDSNSYGKPFLKNNPLHFNLSHSGDWVICALDKHEVGVDIEKKMPIDYSIAEKVFSDTEYNDLLMKSKDEKLGYFYDLWTLKESYIKAIGKGLSIPLKTFSIRKISSDHITLTEETDNTNWSFKQYDLDPDYKLSVCTKGRISSLYVNLLDVRNIYTNVLHELY